VDWDKWVDEDDEAEGNDKLDGFDLSALQNFQNFNAGQYLGRKCLCAVSACSSSAHAVK
jgi:hypothetical protein